MQASEPRRERLRETLVERRLSQSAKYGNLYGNLVWRQLREKNSARHISCAESVARTFSSQENLYSGVFLMM